MRVRAHVDAAAGANSTRPNWSKKNTNEADHAALRRRQHALHGEAVTEIAGA
jgi:hypothetical protein